ncbi:MAG: hypothetical protein ACLFTG_07490 [Alphaproteobacteria bacterium]
MPSIRRAANPQVSRRFPLPPRPIALALLLVLAGGVAAAAPPRLSPAEVATLSGAAGPACTWRFVETTPAAENAWIERWRASDCAAAGTWNLQLEPGPNGRLAVTVLLPGETRQPPAVQAAATLAVLGRAAGDRCRERRVVDTAVLTTGEGRSVERWTVTACGDRRHYRLTFTADQPGPPSIDLEPAAPPTALSR